MRRTHSAEWEKKRSRPSNFLKQANPAKYKPENGAVYPNSEFGSSMMQIAQLIKAGVGLEIAFADTGNGIRWIRIPIRAVLKVSLRTSFEHSARASPRSRRTSVHESTTSSCSRCPNSDERHTRTAAAGPIMDTATRCRPREFGERWEVYGDWKD